MTGTSSDAMRVMRGLAITIALSFLSVPAPSVAATLDTIKARGHLVCGVEQEVKGFSEVDSKGRWTGLEVDFCSALAAVVLGSSEATTYRPLSAGDSFNALKSGEIDILAGGPAWTLSRDTELGVRFVGTLFHDGQGFLVPRSQTIASALELSGASICMLAGTHAEVALSNYFALRDMRYKSVPVNRWPDAVNTYGAGKCDVLTGDISVLAAERARLAQPAEHQILPEVISKEPRGPAVRLGDDQWFSVVRWTLMAIVAAEELGITKDKAESLRSSRLEEIRRFLGQDANLGQAMGLPRDWALQAVKQAGNYGEMYERNVGMRSPLRLPRGLNNLSSAGGLMYAVPMR